MTIMVRPRLINFSSLHRLHTLARAHAGERLIEQQQARLGRQREPDFKPALFAVGKIGHRHVGAGGEMDQRQRLLDPLVEAGDAATSRAANRAGTSPRFWARAAMVMFSRTVSRVNSWLT